ncbi:MAG: sodium-dependent transporter [Pseudomonadota bacterium]
MAAIGRKTDTWGSRFGFIMAAVGSSVGLGNFWRFPFTAGENGGGAFIIIYLLCVLLFGLPVLMAEYALGRKSGRSAIDGISYLAEEEGKSGLWTILGWVGSLAAFGILTFYMVISAWIVAFVPQAFSGGFSSLLSDASLLNANIGVTAASINEQISSIDLASGCSFIEDGIIVQPTEDIQGVSTLRDFAAGDVSGCSFGHTIGNSFWILALLAGFIAINVAVLARGVKGGLERAASILMPLFFVLLIGIVAFSLINGDASKAASFLLAPDFSAVTFETFLAAIGQAFFSIGVGSCLMVTYGAYLSRDTNIPRASGIVAGADTMVAMIAGFAIFPIVFQFGVDPAGGAGLFFVSLPIAFGQMPAFVGGAFFILALFAALTSSISLMEVGVSWLEDRNGIGRPRAAMIVGGLLFAIGALYVFDGALIDIVDFITGQLMLPLGGILVSVFAGWVLSRPTIATELGDGAIMSAWRFACRYIVPPAVAFVLVFGALDTAQNNGWIALPELFTALIGPNP